MKQKWNGVDFGLRKDSKVNTVIVTNHVVIAIYTVKPWNQLLCLFLWVKLTKISYIGTLIKAQFIKDYDLVRQDSLYICIASHALGVVG
jgi:hypothetical protein